MTEFPLKLFTFDWGGNGGFAVISRDRQQAENLLIDTLGVRNRPEKVDFDSAKITESV